MKCMLGVRAQYDEAVWQFMRWLSDRYKREERARGTAYIYLFSSLLEGMFEDSALR